MIDAGRLSAGAVDVAALTPNHPDAGVAAHYGDPLREQRLLASGVGLVDRGHREFLAVTGDDRLAWLHSLTSQHLTALPARSGTELLVLSPQGRIEEHAGVFDDGTTTLLDVEPGRAGPLLDFLSAMVFRMRVALRPATPEWAVLSLVGPATGAALAKLGARPDGEPLVRPVPPAKFATGAVPAAPSAQYPGAALPGGYGYVRLLPGGADLLVPRAAATALVAELGVPLAGSWAYEALRVAARRPRYGFETDHRTLPAEVGWYSAVHLEKGCYRGQETVARVHHLGRPPRRLVLLHLDGVTEEEPPPRHAPVTTADGRAVGFVGTGVRHYELGCVGLALIRHSLGGADRASGGLRVGAASAAIDPGDPVD